MKRPADKRLFFSINVDPTTQGATVLCPDGQGGKVKTTLPIALLPVADDSSTATKDPTIGSYVFAFPVSDTFLIGSDTKVTASGAQGEMFHIFSIPKTKADKGSPQQESSPNQSTRR